MFFNKSLIKCEKFVSCLTQHSKKHWKWPETYKLILHCYWTPQFQNFTNLPIGIFGVSNPLFFFVFFLFCFVLRFLRNYVWIIVNIVSNNTVLMCYLLWIFVPIRRLLQLIVCTGVSTPPHSTQAVVFSVSKETKFEVDTTSIILSYLCHFRNVVNKELFRYLLIYSILNHAS